MERGRNDRKSLWESKAVILYPLLNFIFLFALATGPFFSEHLSVVFPLGHLRYTCLFCLLPTGEALTLPHGLYVSVTKHVLFVCYQDGQH